ncbi:tRNA 2-thiouridine(34) synthase MnmA [Peptostreptococcus russellii]|uniref:tRNA 2-thiouridine(34) synthase MnmA n=1 Tax=Peptostreptococcus russellii TaxID=215200 RepID=UPI0026F10A86|nr:tRNA 2-thiouridine(34) synthase MnmA [Peptostreptococcus russellii]
MENKRVLLGMSGGVDSTVAAYLLREEGYEVVGATMKLWVPENIENTAIVDAKKMADKLGLEHHVIDLEDKFKSTVVKHFIDGYYEGSTPNPCIFCNKHIKFDLMFDVADELGCQYIATGHYCRIIKNEETSKYELIKAVTDKKDQSYMMYNLNQEKLSRILFPIGEYDKSEIREIAEKVGLEVYNKPDSQDICFIPDGDYEKFLEKYSGRKDKKGKFVDSKGNEIGNHQGITRYTIGQRKGLGITFGKPVYVIDINGKDNTVTLGVNNDLFKNELIARDVNFLDFSVKELDKPLEVQAKIRYSSSLSDALVTKIDNNRVKVVFKDSQRAITKGQSVVFYEGNKLIGGGVIE